MNDARGAERRQITTRSLGIQAGAAFLIALIVLSAEGWLSELLAPGTALGPRLSLALFALSLLALFILLQRLCSLVFFGDACFGPLCLADANPPTCQRNQACERLVVPELKEMPKFNRMLIEQLRHVIGQTEKAAFDISSRLQTIDGVVNELQQFVNSAAIESKDIANRTDAEAIESHDLVARLASLIQTRLAESGDGEIRDIARILSPLLDEERSTATPLQEREKLLDFAHRLGTLRASYQRLALREKEALEHIGANSRKLADMFIDTVASVQFQDIVRQQIEQVISGIEHIDSHTQLLCAALQHDSGDFSAISDIPSLDEKFNAFYSSYVMEHQREIHDRAIGSHTPRPADKQQPKIELF